MEAILRHFLKTIPYPYLDNRGNIVNWTKVTIPAQCQSCNGICRSYFKEKNDKKLETCPKGLNVYKAEFNDYFLILPGLYIKGKHGKLPRKKKKTQKDRIMELAELEKWENGIQILINKIDEYKESCVKDSVAVYHDITPTISLIFRTLEAIIAEEAGATFDDKVANTDEKLQTLYHAINLLDNRLKMMPLISNPDAAKFGQVSKCSPYKLFDKVCRIFKDTANRKGITLDLQSPSYITIEPLVYDSFITIPFVLVENAIKYSLPNRKVHINLVQKAGSVMVTVTSYGPVVTTEDYGRIFEKGFKDPNAKKFASQGSGIGLYLADIVAIAHNFEINYKKGNTKIEKNIEIGSNTFSFELRE